MKIIHTLDYYAEGYGRPQAVSNLAQSQRELGHQVEILVGDCFGNPDLVALNHFSPEQYDQKSIARTLHQGWKDWLLERVKELQPDLIHTHELADAWALAGNVPVPVVLSLRVDHRRLAQGPWVIDIASRADWVEYWNPDIAGWLIQGGINNISWNCAPVVIRDDWQRNQTEGLVVSQGRIDPDKNQRLIINCFPEVLRERPDAHLLLIGDGPEMIPLQQLSSSLGISDSVTFAGWKRDPVAYLARSHLAVYPALFGFGFDRAIMEAMMVGVPVITSPDVSPVIHYGRYGLVAEDDQWSNLIVDCLNGTTRLTEMALEAQQAAQDLYTPEAVLQRTEQAYRRVT
jgi:glycosyltransferase involved in cell wall biosynthesis